MCHARLQVHANPITWKTPRFCPVSLSPFQTYVFSKARKSDGVWIPPVPAASISCGSVINNPTKNKAIIHGTQVVANFDTPSKPFATISVITVPRAMTISTNLILVGYHSSCIGTLNTRRIAVPEMLMPAAANAARPSPRTILYTFCSFSPNIRPR